MKVAEAIIEDIERLRPVALEWKETCNGERFGIEIDLEIHFSDLAVMVEGEDAELLLLKSEKGEISGYMGVICFKSPVGGQKIAQEHYWFVSGKNRGRDTMLLIRAAKEWAKKKGCSHIIFNASNLASNMHDKVCRFYERIGFGKFETSYISQL